MSRPIIKPCGADCGTLTDPCGDSTCYHTLRSPVHYGSTDPFDDLSEAESVLSNGTGGCLVDTSFAYPPGRTLSVDLTDTVLTVSDNAGPPVPVGGFSLEHYIRGSFKAANGIDFTYSTALNFVIPTTPFIYTLTLYLYDDSGSLIDSFTDSTGVPNSHHFDVPSDANYYVKVGISAAWGAGRMVTADLDWTLDGGTGSTVCPLRAAYLDGSETAYLVCTP